MTEQERSQETIERDSRHGLMNAVRDPTPYYGMGDVEQASEQMGSSLPSGTEPVAAAQGRVETLAQDQEQDDGVVVVQNAEQAEQQIVGNKIANGVTESAEIDEVTVAPDEPDVAAQDEHPDQISGELDQAANGVMESTNADDVAVDGSVSEQDGADTASEAAEPVAAMQEAQEEQEAEIPADAADLDVAASDTMLSDGVAAETHSTAETEAPAVDDAETPGASFEPGEDEEDVRPRRLKDLEVGMELEGRVTSIALYGIFVDIGVGRDGLVHISEMSDTRINSPSDLVQIGDTVKVRVKGIDVEARRISLTMRPPRSANGGERNRGRNKRPEVNREMLAALKVGDMVDGTITGLAQFGAFVDIGVGKDGLVHISEMSEGHVDKPEDAVQVGDRHTFKILEVDPEGTRISLSLRRAQRIQKMQQLEPGQELEGTVSGMAPFGAFVDIGVGRDGLVHISQLSENRVGKVEDVVKVGDKVTVRVLEVDPQSKRISLTMRLNEKPAEDEEPDQEQSDAPAPAAPTSVADTSRYPSSASQRESANKRESGRKRSGGRGSRTEQVPAQPETYSTGSDDEEEFEGNATLEDLLTKFGGSRRDRRRRSDEEEEEEDERQRTKQRQRDIVRRTLQHQYDDE